MALKKLYLGNTPDREIAAERIKNGQSFSNHTGSLSGQPNPKPWSDRGNLHQDDTEIAIWNQDMMDRETDYVIRSYLTPIAWHRKTRGWFVSEQFHSTTTSKHYGIARMIIDRYDDLLRAVAQ